MSQTGQFTYLSTFIDSLTGDVGGAIVPVAGNIDILGGPGVTVVGTAGTLTINMAGASDSFITDAGTAVPDALGDLNVLGGANINTTGVGNTVTIILDDNVTLAGQLQANEVESVTYITAGTNITSVAGNIQATAGNVVAGGAMTAVGDITTTTGDLNAPAGDADIGGAVNSVGNITSSTGDVIAQVDVQAVTGDIVSSAGAGSFNTTVTAGGNITSTAGNIAANAGNMTASGTVTGGSGLIATTGGVLASAGDITATLGNIVTSAGSIDSASSMSAVTDITTSTGDLVSTAGAVSANTTVTAGGNITTTGGNVVVSAGTVTASGNITSVSGNISTSSGTIDSASTISAVGDITTSTGDLVSTLGDIRAPNGTLYVGTFSATGDIVTTAGDLIATIGDVNAGANVIAGTGVTVTSGGIDVVAGGILVQAGDVLASTGNVTAQMNVTAVTGDVNSTIGDVTAGFDVVAGGDISAVLGDITAEQGDVLARHDVEALEGDIIAQAGDIYTLAGFIRSAGAVIADVNLDVTGTVQFRDIVDGGLIADSDGFVSASVGFTDPFTGFATWTGAGNYFDDTVLGSFEVLRGGTGFIKGVPVTWAGAQTVTGMTAGNTYLIYMDDTGTIGKTTTFSLATFEDYIILFECLRDSTAAANIQYTVKENHPFGFPAETSWWAHETVGTVIENHDNGANITLNGTQKIEIVGADELSDHGLYTDIPDGGGTAEVFNQMLTNGAGKWITYQVSDTFNGFWNSAGTATAPSGTKFSVYSLYVSKEDLNVAIPTYWAVLDDQEYNNQLMAQTAIANGTPASISAELEQLEMCRLGYIIYKQSTTEIIDVIIDKTTFQSGSTLGGGTNLASLVLTNITNFDGILSATDTTVQSSLETIDDWGAATTDHAVLIGQGVGSPIASLAVGATGEVIVGNTGADPTWSTTVLATTFDTNVVAAAVTLAGTSLLADGTDANININITAKGTGQVIIDDLQLTTDLAVEYGGTGAGTFTQYGTLVGAGTGAIVALAAATNGQLAIGSTGANPTVGSITSTDGSLTITPGAGTLVIEGTAAGEAQVGVVELATDAEAIAGTATTVINCTSLKAKLGTQTSHGLPYGAATTGAIAWTAEPSDGQILIGDTGNIPQLGTLTAGTGITVTNAAHAITVASTGTTLRDDTSTSDTWVLADAGKHITYTNAAAVAVSVPTNASVAFAIGTVISFSQGGAGQITLSGAGPPTLQSADSALTTVKIYSGGCAIKILSDTWRIFGDMEA